MNLKPTTFDVSGRAVSSESLMITDEDIKKCLAVKQWFQDNSIPVTQFAWFAAREFDYGDWYTPNFDTRDSVWYEIIE